MPVVNTGVLLDFIRWPMTLHFLPKLFALGTEASCLCFPMGRAGSTANDKAQWVVATATADCATSILLER